MFVGIDLGTSGLRAVLTDASANIIASCEEYYSVAHPHPGWSEQNPIDWTDALDKTMRALANSHSMEMAKVEAIGMSGHMHGATLLDADGAVLRPCILWNDTRSSTEAAELDARADARNISGNIVFPGFTAPKLKWVAVHEPEIFAQTAKVLLPKDYMTYWMTGDYVSDMSDAAGTSWLDVGKRDWSDQMLAACDLSLTNMPRLVEGSEVAGTLKPDLARAWGLRDTVIIAGGGADNAAAACGVGALGEGQGFVSLGTSGVLLTARSSYAPKPASAVHTFCHAVPDTWYQMGVILAATDCMNWLAKTVQEQPSDLSAELGDSISEPGSLRFLPYLSGERTPHNDSAIRGAFLNIDVSTNRTDMTRAVMEGVSFALRDCLEALRSTGAAPERLLVIGGGSNSNYWVELLATVLNLPLDLPVAGDFGAALGAARLAICAGTGADPKHVMTMPDIAKTISPRADLVDAYETSYQTYRALYPALKALT